MSAFAVDPTVPRTTAADIAAALKDPGFGRYFVDFMAMATWSRTDGWHDRALAATGPLSLHPALSGLHYGQQIFEGLKAYRHPDDSVWLFRPEKNAARFAHSATRMQMAPLPVDDFIESVTKVVELSLDWVPQPEGEQSLYLRPFMFASENQIGVKASDFYTYICLGMPVMPFYPEPLKLWVSPTFSRSMAGGTGDAKCGGNYGASMIAEDEAHRNGCTQVLWLDSATRSWVEEGGTMNFLVVTADGELVTPELNGQILAGVTRDSLLKLASAHGLRPSERPLAFAELVEGITSGHITEAFACGTAAVVSPVVTIRSPELDLTVGDGQPGAKTLELRSHLTGIQFGTEPDVHGWMRRVG